MRKRQRKTFRVTFDGAFVLVLARTAAAAVHLARRQINQGCGGVRQQPPGTQLPWSYSKANYAVEVLAS